MTKQGTRGFTLIELLVVISIIGLLASTVLASLSAARSKARDAIRKTDLREIQAALEMYAIKHGTYTVANSGYNGGGNGWLGYENGSNYVTAVTRALYSDGDYGNALRDDPAQNPGYMIYVCDGGKSYSLSATLDNATADDIAHIQTTCNGVGVNGTFPVYGKNYAVGFN